METINSVAAAAAKVVWGENQNQNQNQKSGEEPRSGETGNTNKGEPYDAGNLDEPENQVKPAVDDGASKTSTSSVLGHQQTGVSSDTTAGQNDVRDPENPWTDPKLAPTGVDDTGDGPNEPQKLDGPGPRPLEEVAREHGGDAGSLEKSPSASTTNAAGGDSSASLGQKGGNVDEDEDGPNAKGTGESTGEKYIKSSGLKADGGDFDVTKPGAGREADRLMEEKGIHNPNTDTGHHNSGAAAETESNGSGKKKLTQKIKEKLHRH